MTADMPVVVSALGDEQPHRKSVLFEFRSVSDTWTETIGRVATHLKSGVATLVILDPVTRSASVYRPDVVQQTFAKSDTLVVPEVLPGFSVPVAKLFE